MKGELNMGSVAIFKGKLVKFLAKAGILVPTRGDVDRSTAPAAGEMAFNTDSSALEVYTGSNWAGVESSATQTLVGTPGDPVPDLVFLSKNINRVATNPLTVAEHQGNLYYASTSIAAIERSNLEYFNNFTLNRFTANVSSTIKTNFNGVVYSAAIVGLYTYFVGDFDSYNGQPAKCIAKVRTSTGVLDTVFQAGVNSSFTQTPLRYANGIVVDSNYLGLIVIGDFTEYGGTSANRIVKIDVNTGLRDTNFVVGSGLNDKPEVIEILNTDVYIGGNFTSYNGTTRNRLVKLDEGTGAVNTNFDPGVGFNSTVLAIAFNPSNQLVYVGGDFFTYQGVSARRIVAIEEFNAAIYTSFNTANTRGATNTVRAIYFSGSYLIIGGAFTHFNSTSTPRLVKINQLTADIINTFNVGTGFDKDVRTITADGFGDPVVYVGGDFTTYQGNPANKIIKLDNISAGYYVDFNTTTASTGFLPLTNYTDEPVRVYKILDPFSSNIIVCGALSQFNSVNPWHVTQIVKTLPTGLIDRTWTSPLFNSSSLNDAITDMVIRGNAIFVCGDFTSVTKNNVTTNRPYLVKIDLTTGDVVTGFDTSVGFNGYVNSIVLDEVFDHIYVCGAFTLYGANTAGYLARLDSNTATFDTAFAVGNGFNGQPRRMALDGNGHIYVAGFITYYNSANAQGVAKLNTLDASLTTEFNDGTTSRFSGGAVYSLALDSAGNVYVCGEFTKYEFISRQRILKLDSFGELDTTFNTSSGFNARVEDIAYDSVSNSIYCTGTFTTYKGVNRDSIAKINATTGELDTTFTPSAETFKFVSVSNNAYVKILSNSVFMSLTRGFLYSGAERYVLNLNKTTANISASANPVAYTLQQSDNYTTFLINDSIASTITIPAGLPTGFKFKVVQLGSSSITVLGAGSVVINSAGGITSTSSQYQSLEVVSYAADTYHLTVDGSNAVKSDPTGIAGADAVVNIVTLNQAEYDAITTPSATTLYVIVG